jgi:TonB family protein
LGWVSIGLDLQPSSRADVHELPALSIALVHPDSAFSLPEPTAALRPKDPPADLEDWSVFVPPEPPPEEPVTEFSDDASLSPLTLQPTPPRPVFAVDPIDCPATSDWRARPARAPGRAAVAGGGDSPGGMAGGSGDGLTGAGGAPGNGDGLGFGEGSGRGIGAGSGDGTGSGESSASGSVASSSANTGGARAPRPIKLERGPYPSDARRHGVEGIVLLLVDVRDDGKVGEVTVGESSGSKTLDQAACDAARNWLFTPAEAEGRRVASRVKLRYQFRLTDTR